MIFLQSCPGRRCFRGCCRQAAIAASWSSKQTSCWSTLMENFRQIVQINYHCPNKIHCIPVVSLLLSAEAASMAPFSRQYLTISCLCVWSSMRRSACSPSIVSMCFSTISGRTSVAYSASKSLITCRNLKKYVNNKMTAQTNSKQQTAGRTFPFLLPISCW
jgi:hypothetical protein